MSGDEEGEPRRADAHDEGDQRAAGAAALGSEGRVVSPWAQP